MKRPSVTRKYLAHRILSGALCAAVLLSGLVFAPVPVRAAGKDTHYHISVASNWDTILAPTSNNTSRYSTGQMHRPDGATSSIKTYRIANSYGNRTSKDLEFTLGGLTPVNTANLGAVNISMVYARNPEGGGINVDYNRDLQVKVAVNNGDYLPGSVGVRSSELIAGGFIFKTETDSDEGLFYQIETENLLDIPGVKGNTITSIKILPDGENTLSGGHFYISELAVNTYPSLQSFDSECPAEVIPTISISGDTLRDIAVAEAKRTANTSRGYYSGPKYATEPDATREFFQSDTTNGMDCQTFVWNAISRVSRTNAWAVQFSLNASRAKLVGGLTPNPIDTSSTSLPQYTDTDIVGVAHAEAASLPATRVQQIYQNYAAAKPGDIAVHHLKDTDSNFTHTRLVSQDAVVTYINGDPSQGIDGARSYLRFHEQDNTLKWNAETTRSGYSYIDNIFYFKELLMGMDNNGHGCYVVYTLDEYADESENNRIEKASVEAVFGSKTAGQNFVNGGLNIAVSSNYRIVSYQVKLFNLTDGSDSLVEEFDFVYPYHYSSTSGYNYSNVTGFNYQDSALDTALADLSDGTYRIDMIVDSGPLTSTTQEDVPQTTKSVLFTKSGSSSTIAEVYNVSMSDPDNGTIKLSTESGTAGTSITVTATPDEGYALKEILVDGKPIPGTTFQIKNDHTVSATFVKVYSVSVVQPANGTVSVDKTSGMEGTTVTVTATPDEGYVLEKILVDGKSIEGTTFEITKDHTVSATFKEQATQYQFSGANVDLGNTLDLNFYFSKDYAPVGSYAKIVRTYADSRSDDELTLFMDKWGEDGTGNFYVISYPGLAAKEMCDEVSVTIYNANDTAISETKTDSIRSYAMRAIKGEEEAEIKTPTLLPALVDMLNYGAAAQEYFKYATDDLANSLLTEDQKALATESVKYNNVYEKPANYYGTNLDLESRIRLNLYFTGVTEGMYAEVSYTNHLGNSVTNEPVALKKNNRTHQVSVENLVVADGDTKITCTVYNADGTVYTSVTDSINSYVYRAKESYSWLESIAKFSSSAYAYLHTKTN